MEPNICFCFTMLYFQINYKNAPEGSYHLFRKGRVHCQNSRMCLPSIFYQFTHVVANNRENEEGGAQNGSCISCLDVQMLLILGR